MQQGGRLSDKWEIPLSFKGHLSDQVKLLQVMCQFSTEAYEDGPYSSTLYGDFTLRNCGVAVPYKDVTTKATPSCAPRGKKWVHFFRNGIRTLIQ